MTTLQRGLRLPLHRRALPGRGSGKAPGHLHAVRGLHPVVQSPVVFAKKKKPSTMDNMLSTRVFSFTKQREYHVVISKDYLTPDDKVIFVDDFLAYGNAAKGIIDLCNQAGAELVGMGFIIEKAFQHGRDVIEAAGVRCESLAIVDSLDNCEIKLREE